MFYPGQIHHTPKLAEKIPAKVIHTTGMSMIPDICNMYILLTAATAFEIQMAIDYLKKSRLAAKHDIEPLVTGVGSLATAHSLVRQIVRRKPDLIVQAGIAGCFTDIVPGEVVVIQEEILGDLGVWEGQQFKSLFDLGLREKNVFPFSNGLLMNPYEKLMALSSLAKVRSITVNEITTDSSRIRWYQQNLAPVVESMEGGSLHYVCLQEGVPFLQIRSISNRIGERDKTKWDIQGALRHLND